MEEKDMALDRGERGHRGDHFSRGGGAERDRREFDEDDRDYVRADYDDDYPRHGRPTEGRHWRGRRYGGEEPLDHGRDYDDDDAERRRTLYAEHRDPFLRRGESEGRFRAEGGSWRREARRDESFDDQDRWSGPYAGRGPKGYRRSDERIHEDVCERLMEHPSIDASDVEVSVNEGDVTLTGLVESRAIKHLTETMTETVPGVKEVHNHLRVAPHVGGAGTRLVR
jgi:BON domain